MPPKSILPEMISAIDRCLEVIDGICISLGLIAITGSGTLLFFGVISRFFFQETYAVTEDLSVNLVIWAVMFFGGPVFKRGGHVGMGFFAEKLGGFKKAGLQLGISFTLLFICAIFLWKGAEIVELIYQSGKMSHSGDLMEWYLKIPIPIGGALLGVFALGQMMKILFVMLEPGSVRRVFPTATAESSKREGLGE